MAPPVMVGACKCCADKPQQQDARTPTEQRACTHIEQRACTHTTNTAVAATPTHAHMDLCSVAAPLLHTAASPPPPNTTITSGVRSGGWTPHPADPLTTSKTRSTWTGEAAADEMAVRWLCTTEPTAPSHRWSGGVQERPHRSVPLLWGSPAWHSVAQSGKHIKGTSPPTSTDPPPPPKRMH